MLLNTASGTAALNTPLLPSLRAGTGVKNAKAPMETPVAGGAENSQNLYASIVQQLNSLNSLLKTITQRASPVAPAVDAVPHQVDRDPPAPLPTVTPLDKPRPDESPFMSSVPIGTKPGDIWRGFWQGIEGNCVTVSAIKLAMMKYGHHPQGIFKLITPTKTGFEVTMQDTFKLHISHEELTLARTGSGFEGEDPDVLKDAVFLYAASAKRAQMKNHEGSAKRSFKDAMASLNDGEMPGDATNRLGLHAKRRWTNPAQLAKEGLGTADAGGHSVAVIDGYADLYGNKVKLSESGFQDARRVLTLR
ncbi:hypothetical protein [Pseudomonas orientalis]|uniref:hypothetical protein n=1 Tax=Pseudomonas orientalis TaxID=76758 RepID=UPI0032082998